MFPPRQRRPQYPYPRTRYQRPRIQRGQAPNNLRLSTLFQDNEGKFDVNRIFTSINQMEKTYKQVSPFISKFMKR
ncbi:YppG family protein [Oceanobacillus chungangensis]|uniref:YppG-like protein n=1 Tax=Oceanobacillus chungangensis TaxID=1229152 RepID=A0A3D8PKV7_9BACI|nr:YppG family protein [Oceanobacillus chungangensis]RDW15889.1 hypothetical protein CWR45_15435 [Oceanobacillus chungangensis]